MHSLIVCDDSCSEKRELCSYKNKQPPLKVLEKLNKKVLGGKRQSNNARWVPKAADLTETAAFRHAPPERACQEHAVIADCLHGKTGEKEHWLVTGNTKQRWEDSF